MDASAIEFEGWVAVSENHATEESWLAARRSMIGASESAALIGEGYKDQNVASIWLEKTRGETREFSEAENRRLRIGKQVEPVLRAEFEHDTGLKCMSPGPFRIFRHPNFPWLGATLDGVTYHDEFGWCPVELKNVSEWAASDWEDDGIPVKFEIQIQHQMAVTGASVAYLVGLIGGQRIEIRQRFRNDEAIVRLLTRNREFWSYVESKTVPPLSDVDLAVTDVRKLFPTENGELCYLPEELQDIDEQLVFLKEERKRLDEQIKVFEARIELAIGEYAMGQLPNGVVWTHKEQHRKEYVTPAKSFRVLRRKG